MTSFEPPPSDAQRPSAPPGIPPPPPSLGPPPGYSNYGSSASLVAVGFKRIKGIAKALEVLLMISMPLQAIGVIGLFQLRGSARELLDGDITRTEFNEATSANLSNLSGLLVIPIAVLTIIAMYRMARNLRLLGRAGATWAPGWAIGGWFLPPCVIYAIPWLMFRELWRGSDPDCAPHDATWKQRPVSPLVNVWWVLYGLLPLIGFATAAGLVSNLANLADPDEIEIAQRLDDFGVLNVVLAVVSIVTTVVYLVMMRQLTARHMRATQEV